MPVLSSYPRIGRYLTSRCLGAQHSIDERSHRMPSLACRCGTIVLALQSSRCAQCDATSATNRIATRTQSGPFIARDSEDVRERLDLPLSPHILRCMESISHLDKARRNLVTPLGMLRLLVLSRAPFD
ncbi:hypothetical protein PsYK624_074060 [Phanerochaete sordida]|uniref:Uncharacterized protein n=1 Tax=Phanerochaete sordida TaxID=48140 RepID=A0A9P3LER2_9APHY|nr:hypothetical protein PsYK624_074060 [Phanerochaete sordida]